MDSSKEKHIVDVVAQPAPKTGNSDTTTGEVQPAASNGNVIDDGLQRGLKSRHLQMIAFGGVVGSVVDPFFDA